MRSSLSRLVLSQFVGCSPHCVAAESSSTLLISRGLARRRETKASYQLERDLNDLKQGQIILDSTTPAAAVASTSQSAGAEAPKDKKWLPKWLDFLNPTKDKSKEAEPKGEGKMDWKDIEKVATNFEIEVYRQLCYNARTSNDPPTPRIYKKPLNSRVQGQYLIDLERVAYLRTSQHEQIASNLTASQRVAVKEDCHAVLRNQELLKEMAGTVGYSVPEVQDCLRTYNQMKQRINYLYRWKKMGRTMPDNREEIDRVVKQLQESDAHELERRAFAKRDKASCPLNGKIGALGTNITCPHTKMPYSACCGSA